MKVVISGGRRKTLIFIVTNVVSLACLWWVLHDQRWSEFWDDIKSLHWGWVLFAVLADVAVYVFQGWRWSLLLKPVDDIPIWRSVRAVYVGLFANEILPFRAGELIRCYLQAEWSKVPLTVSLSSAIVERVFDGFWLVAGLGLAAVLVPGLPTFVLEGAIVLAVFVAAAGLLLALAMFHKHRMHRMLKKTGWQRHLLILIEDLYVIGHSRYLYYSALMSVPYLLLQVVPFYAMMRAYGFVDYSWGTASLIMVVMRLSSVVPQAPGHVGTFQYLLAKILIMLQYGSGYAKRFSFIMWAAITLPLLIVGSVALIVTGARIDELHRQARAELPLLKDEDEKAADVRAM